MKTEMRTGFRRPLLLLLGAITLVAGGSAAGAAQVAAIVPTRASVWFGVDSGAIAGQIRFPDGTPAQPVRVRFARVDENGEAGTGAAPWVQTDADGRYSLNNAAPGRYRVEAGSVDYPSYYPGVKTSADARLVTVVAGAPTLDIDFTLTRPAFTVTGRVTPDPRQRSPLRVEVRLWNNEWGSAKLTDGSFSFTQVPPGYYAVQLGNDTGGGRTIHVDDRDITDLELPAPLMVPVSGIVREKTGRPLPTTTHTGSDVPRPLAFFLRFVGNGKVFEAPVNTSGTFAALLPEGAYHVVPSGLPATSEVVSITEGPASYDRDPLKISSAEARTLTVMVASSLEVPEAPREFAVRGRVVNPNGPPNSDERRVQLWNYRTQLFADIRPDGSFEFPKAAADSYYIRLSPIKFYLEPVVGIPVHVSTRDITDLVLTVLPEATVRGRVRTDGKLPPSIQLRFSGTPAGRGPADLGFGALVRPDGSFELNIPAGEYNVEIPEVPPGFRDAVVQLSDPGTKTLKVGAAGTAEIVVALGQWPADSRVKVSGRLTGVGGIPGNSVFHREVRLRGGLLYRETRTAEDGSFEFFEVPPGPATLTILIPEGFEIPLVVKDKDIGPIEVSGRPNNNQSKSIEGRVVIPEGYPTPDLRVDFNPIPRADGTRPSCHTVAAGNLKPDGSFSMSCHEGSYQVFAYLSTGDLYFEIPSITYGGKDARRELQIGPSAESLVITLAPRPDAMWRKVSGRASQAGVEVILRGTLGNSAKTVTNADATFEFSRLIPDRYTIWAGSTAVTLILNDRDIRGVTLPSYSVTKVSGRVDVEGGRGLPMLMSLSLTSSAPPFTSPSLPLFLGIKTDGSFTAEIPEGSYRVALADREMPPGYRLKSIEYGGTNILDGVLVVGPEARDLRIVLAAPPSPAGVRVSGRVDVSAIGGGAAIPRVILARHFPSWTFVAAPAPDGVFEFRDVSPGTYRIWLEGAARAPAVVYVGPQDVAGVTLAAPERATKPQ